MDVQSYLLGLFIPCHTIVAAYYGFPLDVHLSVRPSVRLSVFHFQMITLVNINELSPNLVCDLILWRSGLELLMGKFYELCAGDMPIFSFSNLT